MLTLVAGVSLAVTACAAPRPGPRTEVETAAGAAPRTTSPATALTVGQARQALLTETDLGSQWTRSRDTAGGYDDLLRATVDGHAYLTHRRDAAACQRLLDRLRLDGLLDEPGGQAHASAVFDAEDGGRLRYTVGTYPTAQLGGVRAWLGTLPHKCNAFQATRPDGGTENVQVSVLDVPKAGDMRQALLVVVKGRTDGVPFTLSLNVAFVTAGTSSAITLINGGLGGASADSTAQAVRLGAQRLATVLAGGTPPVWPQGQQD
ncbi:hypothetical protein [Streptomyces sp. NPDC004629]|uniref:hypothetical protein n=1 Tax=Streptomyces sp. NPDC004629 TaxID=3364705 RepID=UPI00367BAAD5